MKVKKLSALAMAILAFGVVEVNAKKSVEKVEIAQFYKEQCLSTSDFATCEMWDQYDPDGFAEYFPYKSQFLGELELADLWGVTVKEIKNAVADNPQLLTVEAVESVDGFNPFSTSLEQLEQGSGNADQIYKWLRYRRAELGICFEDEQFNENLDRCVVIE